MAYVEPAYEPSQVQLLLLFKFLMGGQYASPSSEFQSRGTDRDQFFVSYTCCPVPHKQRSIILALLHSRSSEQQS